MKLDHNEIEIDDLNEMIECFYNKIRPFLIKIRKTTNYKNNKEVKSEVKSNLIF